MSKDVQRILEIIQSESEFPDPVNEEQLQALESLGHVKAIRIAARATKQAIYDRVVAEFGN